MSSSRRRSRRGRGGLALSSTLGRGSFVLRATGWTCGVGCVDHSGKWEAEEVTAAGAPYFTTRERVVWSQPGSPELAGRFASWDGDWVLIEHVTGAGVVAVAAVHPSRVKSIASR